MKYIKAFSSVLMSLSHVPDFDLLMTTIISIFYSCNMGTSDLPDMYAQNPRAQSEGCGHTYQANHECPCYKCYVTLPVRLIALMPIRG